MVMHPVKSWISKKEISQAEFARRLGWTPSYLSQVLNGHRGLSKEQARKISDATGGEVTVPELLLWERPAA